MVLKTVRDCMIKSKSSDERFFIADKVGTAFWFYRNAIQFRCRRYTYSIQTRCQTDKVCETKNVAKYLVSKVADNNSMAIGTKVSAFLQLVSSFWEIYRSKHVNNGIWSLNIAITVCSGTAKCGKIKRRYTEVE